MSGACSGIFSEQVVIVDLLKEHAVPEICEVVLKLLTDETVLKLGFSLPNDLRRVVPALEAVLAGPTDLTLPQLGMEAEPAPESTPATTESASNDSDAVAVDSIDPIDDEETEDVEDSEDDVAVLDVDQEAECLGPTDVAKDLDRLGCLDGSRPAAEQFFDLNVDRAAELAESETVGSSQVAKTIILSLAVDVDGAELPPPPVTVACVLHIERRLQLGRCATALGCPRSALKLVAPSKLVSVCGFPRGAIGPVGLLANSTGQPPRVLLDEELMPAELPTTGAGADGEVISSEALEAATILCGAGQEDLVYRVRPRRLVDALGATVSVIHAEGVGGLVDTDLKYFPTGQNKQKQMQKQRRWSEHTGVRERGARHTLDLQAALGQMLPLRTADGKQRKLKDGPLPHPGLADTVLQVLGFRLDKAMQCSAWSDRPLGVAQLQYAAKDALVLHSLYEKICTIPQLRDGLVAHTVQ